MLLGIAGLMLVFWHLGQELSDEAPIKATTTKTVTKSVRYEKPIIKRLK